MNLMFKFIKKMEDYYRSNIVIDRYPMLTSISRRQLKKKGAMGLVYMLHHVSIKNPNGIPTNEELKVSPTFLEKIIIKYKKQGFTFISLEELSEISISNKISPNPFIAITFDDGYSDNYTEALPVFERQQVPFTIFVATDFIDQKTILWWDILEDLILKNDSIQVGGKEYRCRTFQEKWDVFRLLRKIILCIAPKKLKDALEELFSYYDIDWYEPVRRQAMTWEQINTISQHPLCTIGGHTVSHPVMNQLSEEEFRQEVSGGIEKLQAAIGKPIHHFAYPYGSPNEIGEREYQLISEFGFKTVFSSYGGCITNENKHNTTHLPRVYLHER